MWFFKKNKTDKQLTFKEIKDKLDSDICGQDELKKDITIAISNYNKYVNNTSDYLKKNNILLIGPAGSGKTLTATTIVGEILNLPNIVINCASLVRSGYVGESLDNQIKSFTEHCHNFYSTDKKQVDLSDKSAAVILDEIDKLSAASHNSGSISTSEVQNQLLPYLDEYGFFGSVPVNNILFVGTATFNNVYRNLDYDYTQKLTAEQVSNAGFSQELFGRFKQKIYLPKPGKEVITQLLTSKMTKNPILHYKELIKLDGNELIVSNESIDRLSYLFEKSSTGVRGIHQILEDKLQGILYESLQVKKQKFELVID